jgi:hypothetical protein
MRGCLRAARPVQAHYDRITIRRKWEQSNDSVSPKRAIAVGLISQKIFRAKSQPCEINAQLGYRTDFSNI